MYANKLLDDYRTAKNYIQDKQIAADLGVSYQKVSKIRKGERYLTETEAIFLAENIGLDKAVVLVYLAADKSKTFQAQQIWDSIAKKFESQRLQTLSVLVGAFSSGSLLLKTPISECVLCEVM